MTTIAAHDMVRRLVRLALQEPAAELILNTEDDWLWSEASEIELASLPDPENTADPMDSVADASRRFVSKLCAQYPGEVRTDFNPETCDIDSPAPEG